MATNQSDVKLVISAVNNASKELSKVGNDMAKLSQKMDAQKQSSLNLTKAAGYLTAGYLVLKKGIMDSVEAYNEQAIARNKLKTIMMNHAGVQEKDVNMLTQQADALSQVGVASKGLILSAQAQLATFDLLPKSIQQITPALIDMAVAEKGVNLTMEDGKAVAQSLGQAFMGNFESLTKQGFKITETQKKIIKFGDEQERLVAIADILGTTYKDVNSKALETFGGKMIWLKNQAKDLQVSLGEGLTQGVSVAFSQMSSSLNKSQADMVYYKEMVKNFGIALVNGFVFVGRSLWNMAQAVGRAIATPFAVAYGSALDAVQSMRNLLDGDFRVSTENTRYAWEITAGGIGEDLGDMKDAFINAFEGSEMAMNNATEGASGFTDGIESLNEGAEQTSKGIENLTKKIEETTKAMKKAIKSAKQDIKDLKKAYKEDEKEAKKELGGSVAEALIAKEEERASIQKEYNEATTDEERETAKEKMDAIDAFFVKHKEDYNKYAKELKETRAYNSLDEIEKLKKDYEDARKERKKQYEQDLKDLKKHLKEVKEEYKDKLKDLRKELMKQLGDITIKVDVKKESTTKRAFGGSVMAGQGYIVGEHRPEVFVPSQSGNIKQADQMSREVNINFNNVSVRNDSDLDAIVKAVKSSINKEQELYKLGAM